MKIEHLTSEQWQQMRDWRERAYKIGASTDPCDRPRFERAVTAMYAELGKPAPKFIWCPGPTLSAALLVLLRQFESEEDSSSLGDRFFRDQLRDQLWGQLRGQLRDQLGDQLRDQLGGQLWDQLWGQLRRQLGDQLWGQLRDQLRDQLGDQLRDQLGGQLWDQLWDQLGDQLRDQLGGRLNLALWGCHEYHWPAHYEFCARIGVKFSEKQAQLLALWVDVCEAGHWWWPQNGIVVASERPLVCTVDDDRRLHNVAGPALAYGDGTKLHAINGVRLPAWVVEQPDTITVEKIDAEHNAEVRRIMTERYGVGRYLTDTGATVIEMDGGRSRHGGAPRCLMQDKRNRRWLVGTDGSTRRVYHMQVPPTVNTCDEAHEALCGIKESAIVAES